MGRPCGCCCGCTHVNDRSLADGTCTEVFRDFAASSVTNTATAYSGDGSTINCQDRLRSATPPCRLIVQNGVNDSLDPDPLFTTYAHLWYFRFYDSATWTPDGRTIGINLSVDSKLVSFSWTGAIPVAPSVLNQRRLLAAKQGATLGFCGELGPAYYSTIFPPGSSWVRERYQTLGLGLNWQRLDPTDIRGDEDAPGVHSWIPDQSVGAPTITFGVVVFSQWIGPRGTAWNMSSLLDNVCISLV